MRKEQMPKVRARREMERWLCHWLGVWISSNEMGSDCRKRLGPGWGMTVSPRVRIPS